MGSTTHITFRLKPDDSGWPPVAAECIPAAAKGEATYEILVPPFFVQDISVGDIVDVEFDQDECVADWSHSVTSRRSTVWILLGNSENIDDQLDQLKTLGCNIERLPKWSLFSVDIPSSVNEIDVEKIFADIENGGGHLAFPSYRH